MAYLQVHLHEIKINMLIGLVLVPVAHLSFVNMKYPVYVRMYINDMLKPVLHLSFVCAIQCMHYTERFSL